MSTGRHRQTPFSRLLGAGVAVAASLGLAAATHSLAAIQLEPPPGAQAMVHQTAKGLETVSGACGAARVEVAGAEVTDDFFTVDRQATKITLTTGAKSRVIDAETREGGANILEDLAGVACVRRAVKSYLLIWTNCDGNTCPTTWAFWVIDAATLRTLAPTRPGFVCGARCASHATGSQLPRQLDAAE